MANSSLAVSGRESSSTSLAARATAWTSWSRSSKTWADEALCHRREASTVVQIAWYRQVATEGRRGSARAALEAGYGTLLEQTHGNARQTAGGEVLDMQAFRG
jgi:hypothetical protein